MGIVIAVIGVFIGYRQLTQGEHSSASGSSMVREAAGHEKQDSGANTNPRITRQDTKVASPEAGSVTANGDRSVAMGTVYGNVTIH